MLILRNWLADSFRVSGRRSTPDGRRSGPGAKAYPVRHISLYLAFLFFGGADVTYSEFIIALRPAEKQKKANEGRVSYQQANPTGFELALPIAGRRLVQRTLEKIRIMIRVRPGDPDPLLIPGTVERFNRLVVGKGRRRGLLVSPGATHI